MPELTATAWGDGTVRQTLDMTTGAGYAENFADPQSGIFRLLMAAGLVPPAATYSGPRAVLDFLKTAKKEGEHDDGFRYKSADTEVIGWVLQRNTAKSYAELVSEKIWRHIGAEQDAFISTDPAGAQVTSIGLSATLRDLARLGEMLRNGGWAEDRQVVPMSVIAEIRNGTDRDKFKASKQEARYGYS